jgi:hypothetical protein
MSDLTAKRKWVESAFIHMAPSHFLKGYKVDLAIVKLGSCPWKS